MKLPTRSQSHISESASLRIVKSSIPDHWILRDVTERDYGIDCYLELVNAQNQLTGDLISLQIKARQAVNWNTQAIPRFMLSDIRIETTNYWNGFVIPVYLILVDIDHEDVFFVPVKEYIRQSYSQYQTQASFSYEFRKDFKLTKDHDSQMKIVVTYFMEKNRVYFETNMLRFFVSIGRDREFILENIGRDSFMPVEIERQVQLRALIVQIKDLCFYLNIDWDLDYNGLQLKSQMKYGKEYTIHEEFLSVAMSYVESKIDSVYAKCSNLIINVESEYWVEKDNVLFNYLMNRE